VAATLLGRPLGAVVIGRLADRAGRTRTTAVAIAGTAVCSLLVAALPDHRVLGGATFVLLVLLRMLGGAFIAGEYSAAVPLAMEWAPPRHRGLASGLVMAMAPCAQATTAFATALLLWALGPEAYAHWGWRVGFVVGGLASLLVLLFYTRRVADAVRAVAPGGRDARRGSLRELLVRHREAFWRMFGLMSGLWCLTNMVVILLAARLVQDQGLPAGRAALVMGVASLGQAAVMALTGHLSTLLGRRRFFTGAGLLAAVAAPALWLWTMGQPHGVRVLACCAVLLQVLTVCTYGPVGAYLSEAFPAHVRSVGYGTAYSASIVLPALHPWWLGPLSGSAGRNGSVALVLALGGLLVAGSAAVGPRLAPDEISGARP